MTTRKAQFKVGAYTIKEGPTGGWSVRVTGATPAITYNTQPISVHGTSADAKAAAERYDAADKRRLASSWPPRQETK